MNIFVDESGSFVSAGERDSWCVVVAYASPEVDRAPLQRVMAKLRTGSPSGGEIKLGVLGEARYLRFLDELQEMRGVLFAVCMDMSVQTAAEIVEHRDGQAEKVVEHREKMIHESMRRGLSELRDSVRSLPPQLYAQLVCQIELFHEVLKNGSLYFVQRWPATLGHFRWRVDRKNTTPTRYEQTFRLLLPALLQTKSMRDPMPMLEGADYSFFQRFIYGASDRPTYLEEGYGIEVPEACNVGKLVAEDFKLVDSRLVDGVQVADLLASGLRRVLRDRFQNRLAVAKALGALMVEGRDRRPPLRLIGFGSGSGEVTVSDSTARTIRIMARHSGGMVA